MYIHYRHTEDKKVPTPVQEFADHKMVGVDCESGDAADAHTLFLEDNSKCIRLRHQSVYFRIINFMATLYSGTYILN